MIKFLEKDNFKEEVNSQTILVDFYADWCGPCRQLGSVLENINTVDILKVNVDNYPDIAKEYGVMSIPTLIIFKDGKDVSKKIGLQSLSELESWIKDNI